MDKQIRILLIIFSFDIEAVGGGISRFVISLSKALDPSIFQISVCGLWNHGTQIEEDRINQLNSSGIHAFSCAPWNQQHPYRSFYNAYRYLRTIIKKEPFDIIHSHSLFGDIAAICLYFERKATIILRTLHNELRTEWSRRPIRRILLTNFLNILVFDLEIGVSQFITGNLNDRWLSRRLGRRAITIHNALDTSRFSSVNKDISILKGELGLPADAFVIGSVGRLTRQKGYDVLLNAAIEIIQSCKPAYFIIVGEGEDANILKQQAVDLKIEHRVLFTGSRPDVEELLSIMDVFVCSSRWEGLSTALLEAMAAGVPIVVTDIPGNRELLQPGISARYVKVEDANDLAIGVVEAYHDPNGFSELAKNAGNVVKSFRIDKIAKIHEQVYQILVSNKQTGRRVKHKINDHRIQELMDSLQN